MTSDASRAAPPISTAATHAGAAPVVALEGRGLAHRFGGGRGLKRVEFAIQAPSVVAVTGANGSGKSTLLRIVAGLLRPSDGTLAFRRDGRDVPPLERRAHIGFASPELAFYPELTAAENLRFAAEAHGLDDRDGAVTSALVRTGLSARAGDRYGALSSGMKQRLRLAFALLHGAPLLLLDEPGSHMDEEGRVMLESLVAEHARAGLVVIATNEEREWRLADERIQLAGRGLGDPA